MKLGRTMSAAALACLALAPAAARGAGYGLYEQGAAVLGMAGAGTAAVSDPSAVYFNPAALTTLTGTRLYAGGTVHQTFTSFAGVGPEPGFGVTEEMEPQRIYPPAVYLSHRYPGPWAIGLGVNSNYGLQVGWKSGGQFSGRHVVTGAILRTSNIGLVASRTLGKNWSIGFGGNLVYSRLTLGNTLFVAAPGGGGAAIEAASFGLVSDPTPGYGWNGGLTWTPLKSLKLGASYRGRVVLHADGKADVKQYPTGDPQVDAAVAAELPPDQDAVTVMRLPSAAALGVAWYWGSAWTLAADAVYTGWSVLEDIPIHFQSTPSTDMRVVEEYDDSFQVRAGFENRRSAFTVRAGYFYDQAAAPVESVSPMIPDSDRHGASFGLGLGFGPDKRLSLDLYQLAAFAKNRTTDGVNRDGYEGEYKSFSSATGLSIAYSW